MGEGNDAAQAGAEGAAKRKGIPIWLGVTLGVALLLAAAGGIWFAYESGKTAGFEQGVFTEETSASVAPAVEETAVVEMGTDTATVPAEGEQVPEAAETQVTEEPPASPTDVTAEGGGSDSGSSGSSGSNLQLKPGLKSPMVSLWSDVNSYVGSSANFKTQNFHLDSGKYRFVVKILDGKQNGAVLRFARVSPGLPLIQKIWSTGFAQTGASFTSQTYDCGAGDYYYRLEQNGGQSTISITLQRRK